MDGINSTTKEVEAIKLPIKLKYFERYHNSLINDICDYDLLLLFKLTLKEKYNDNPNILFIAHRLNKYDTKRSGKITNAIATSCRFQCIDILKYLLNSGLAGDLQPQQELIMTINSSVNDSLAPLKIAVEERSFETMEMIISI